MKVLNVVLSIAFATAIHSSCRHQEAKEKVSKPDVLRANMDTTVDPGKDFYLYTNGDWLRSHPIPETESRWGIGNLVVEEIYLRLRKISEDAAKVNGAPKNSTTQRIGDLYASAMDSAGNEKLGLSPLKKEMDEISAIKDISGLVAMITKLQTYRALPAFQLFVAQDEKNSDAMAMHLSQDGLGLPNRDYYFNMDSRTQNIRREYLKYLQKVIQLAGSDSIKAKTGAKNIMSLETDLAKYSRKLEDLRDPYANYHKIATRELNKLVPAINWEQFFRNIGLQQVPDSVIVGQPEFFKALGRDLTGFSLDAWKDYLRMRLIGNYADKIGGDFYKEEFYFYRTVLTGAKKPKPLWKRVIDYENEAIGELLGQAFVKEYFPAKTKQRYETLVNNVLDAYKVRIMKLDWMSDTTKQKALKKLNTVTKKIGYPEKWKDFSGLDISRQPYVRNAVNIDRFWFDYNMKKLGKPVDRKEWDMNPQEYNAYYNPSNNEIVLPAAAFAVPGYADSELDDAVVYGYAGGSTIGHEITHGFDDEGRLYDEKGNLNDWWTKGDVKRFNEKARKYVEQFSSYVVLDSLHINGKATLGENIADLGGIVIGLDAFKKTDQYKSGKKLAGLTPLQRYFMGYALGWMIQQRDQRLANQILTDVHAPAKYRVNGPVSNIPEFYQAFNVKPNEPLWRADTARVMIW